MPEDLNDRLQRIETKLDQMIEFRDLVLSFVMAGPMKKAALAAKVKITNRGD